MIKTALSSAILALGSAGLVLAGPISNDAHEATPVKETVLAANSKDVTIGSSKSIGSDRNNKDDGSGNVVIRGKDDSAAQGDCTPGAAGREGRVTRGRDNVIGDSQSSGKNSGRVTIRGGKAGKPGGCDSEPDSDPADLDDTEENPEDNNSDK